MNPSVSGDLWICRGRDKMSCTPQRSTFPQLPKSSGTSFANGGKTAPGMTLKRVSPTNATSFSITRLIEPAVWPGVGITFAPGMYLLRCYSPPTAMSGLKGWYFDLEATRMFPIPETIFENHIVPMGNGVMPFSRYSFSSA